MGGQIQVSQFLYLLATALSSGWENHEWIFLSLFPMDGHNQDENISSMA